MTSRASESRVDRPAGWAACLVSLAIHACLIVALAATTRAYLRGINPGATNHFVLHLAEDGPELTGDEGTAPSDAAVADGAPLADAGFSILPRQAEPEAAMLAPPRLPMLGLVGGGAAPSGGGGAGSGRGSRRLAHLVVPARLTVFGAEAVGTKFVFVFDHSTSMAGAPLAAAKQQLVGSLAALDAVHQFQVIFFNHQFQAWDLTGGQRRIPFASDRNKELGARFVERVVATGATERKAPLMRALAMSPDAVFFLTDADDAMPSYDVADVVTRAQRSGTAIACIEFGDGPASSQRENFLTQLARATGGQYVYVDIVRLHSSVRP